MRKNLQVEVPRGAHTEVQRRRGLKKSIFTRTRIAVLSLILVLSLSVTGTLAYLQWTANQTPNRASLGEVQVRIGEKASLDATSYEFDKDGDYSYGKDSKVVCVAAGDKANEQNENVYVSIVPQVESYQYSDNAGSKLSDAYMSFEENWSELKQETDTSGKTWDYIETSIMKVYLAQGWSNNWTYQSSNGIFRYNKALEKGQKTDNLISGVVLQDTVNVSNYRNVKLTVIAQGILNS